MCSSAHKSVEEGSWLHHVLAAPPRRGQDPVPKLLCDLRAAHLDLLGFSVPPQESAS